MKYSIKKQLAFIFIVLLSAMQILFWVCNAFLLERYYVSKKRDNLMEIYTVINDWSNRELVATEEFDEEIQKICSTYSISFIITDAASNTIKTSINDAEDFNRQLRDIIFERGDDTQEVILEGVNYTISNLLDQNGEAEYLVMWGNLDNGNFFMLRASMEGIHNSANMANAFFLNVLMIVVVLAVAMIWIVSEKVGEPILELADLSKRMAQLDFDARYEGNDKNEIAILGESFNLMSEKLEETISSLKSANLKLQRDVESQIRIDNMRKEFVANVSHELKTPIAIIQGYAEGLMEGITEDPESQKYYCEVIMDETAKMNRMVKNLITLSQLESDADAISMERFDLTDLIRNCIQSSEILAVQTGIRVVFEPEQEVSVWADEYQIEEVFRNFLSNASHHAAGSEKRKEKLIEVAVTKTDGKVRVSVFNTGKQIPEESLDHIWDKFYKVDKARTREYGGTGIGLSIVKAVMERIGQAYGVINHEDGVEFYFELETA
ncbi:MAG: cell wall metabolism sensor histidine kinase WalK [Lachnospiraceae bacterium]|nr:cell wall metabolism sensor histidine kinase WalK [Lachnospiraceae bacterium]